MNTTDSFAAGWHYGNRCCRELTARQIEELFPDVDTYAFTQGNLDGVRGDRFRLDFLKATAHERCSSCEEPVESPEGILDLDEAGLCEHCAGKREKARIEYEDLLREGHYDHSMDG